MSENDSLVRKIIKILCNLENQETTISNLVPSLAALGGKIPDKDGIVKCLQLFPHLFKTETKARSETKVFLQVHVKLCRLYQIGLCQGDANCDGLHVCATFFLSGLCLTKGSEKCAQVHQIHTAHNLNILRAYLMDKLSKEEVRSVFRHPRNRTRATLPPMCSSYMEAAGCSNETCLKLHICQKFLLNSCNDSCLKNHRQTDGQAKEILKMYGISMGKSTKDILRDLVSMNQCARITYPQPPLQPASHGDQTKAEHKPGISKQHKDTDHSSFTTSSDLRTSVSNSSDAARAPTENSEMDVKGDIVRKTVKILCQNRNCECTLQTLVESLKSDGTDVDDYTDLTKSFEGYSDIFVLSDDQSVPATTIGIKAKINLCEEFQNPKTKCTKGDACNALHICQFYILSDSCTFQSEKRPCIFGHNIEIPHNKKILRSFCLDQLGANDIRNILKCPRNRTSFTTPKLCWQFQRNSCSIEKKCRYLHLCREYVSGTCKRDECQGHDVFGEDAADLLKRYGLKMDQDEKEIIEDLRSMDLTSKVFPKSKVESGTGGAEGPDAGERKGRAQQKRDETSRKGTHDDSKRRQSRSLNRQINTHSMSVANPQSQMHGNVPPPRNPMPGNQQNMPYQRHGHQPGQMPQFPNPPYQQGQYNQGPPGPNYYNQGPPQTNHGHQPGQMPQFPNPPSQQGQYNQGPPGPNYYNQGPPQTNHGHQPGQMPQFPNPPSQQGQYNQGPPGPNYYHKGPQQPNQWNSGQPRPPNYGNQGPQHPIQWNTRQPQPWQQNYSYPGPNQWNPGPSQPNYPACSPEVQQGQTPSSSGQSNVGNSTQKQQQQKQQNTKTPQKQQDQREMTTGEHLSKTGPKHVEKDSEEICLFNFRTCFRGDNCNYHHRKVTFQWQYKLKEEKEEKEEGGQPWRDFDYDSNTELETTYSDPKEDTCPVAFRKGEIITINYDDMTGSSKRTKIVVRRLSTSSSEAPNLRPPNNKWSTVWKWFWQDEAGTWIEYGEKDRKGFTSLKNSEAIEQMFLANPKGNIEFTTTANKYKLDLDNMTQTNTTTSVQRRVRRRPKFFTKEELRKRPIPNSMQNKKAGPTGWSIGQSKNQEELSKHYAEINVDETSEEYKKISTLFYETIPTDRKISSVERIENGELWMSFDTQREKMKRKATGTGTVEERSLFHGTTEDKIEAICRQGFDFRFSGFRVGAIHGKGSYFAKDAKYSDNYAQKSDQAKKMFIARVLVGQFTKGDKGYVRPPAKSAENPHDLYDSCVDNIADPTIFVVFTVDQAYPEYIVTYT